MTILWVFVLIRRGNRPEPIGLSFLLRELLVCDGTPAFLLLVNVMATLL